MIADETSRLPVSVAERVEAKKTTGIQWLRLGFFLLAVTIGAVQSWTGRYLIGPDGISYVDLAHAWLRHDWGAAVNLYWSPLYPLSLALGFLVLHPSPYWEHPVVHLVGFLIFLVALSCFDFFWRTLLADREQREALGPAQGSAGLPNWALLTLGYTFFLWALLNMCPVYNVTPDMGMTAFIFLASGLILRIRRGRASWRMFALLGIILGLAYLQKAMMFPLAFVFLAVGALVVSKRRRGLRLALVGVVAFLAVAGPYVAAMRVYTGRLTFGDAGKLNYAWWVDGVPKKYWEGEIPGCGTPLHAPRKLLDTPPVYEYATPVGGTWPAWFDPGYWHEGLRPFFRLRGQLQVLNTSLRQYRTIFLGEWGSRSVTAFLTSQFSLLLGCCLLFWMEGRPRLVWRRFAQYWPVWVPAITGMGMMSLVLVEARYVLGFLALVWAALLCAVRLPETPGARKLVTAVTAAVVICMGLPAVHTATTEVIQMARGQGVRYEDWEMVQSLQRLGIRPGDKIAAIAHSDFGWAPLCGLTIVADIPVYYVTEFWQADPVVQARALHAFAQAGAKLVVAQRKSANSSISWQRMGRTRYYVHMLAADR